MTTKNERFAAQISNGFDAGSYANAYETQDLNDALARLSMNRSTAYRDAFTLGFLSSHTLEEMGSDVDAYITAYHSEAGKACLAAGYCDVIDENELKALFE